MIESDENTRTVSAALRAVRSGSEDVMNGRRKDDLVAARKRRDRAIVKAVPLAGATAVAESAGISVTRVKQICQQSKPTEKADR